MQCTNNVEIVFLKQTELASMNYVEISYLHSNFHTLPSTKEKIPEKPTSLFTSTRDVVKCTQRFSRNGPQGTPLQPIKYEKEEGSFHAFS